MSLEHSPERFNKTSLIGEEHSLTFLNQAMIALLLGVSERTMERWRLEGSGPPFRKFGRRVMYSRADVIAWANAQRRTSTSNTGISRTT